MGKLKTEKIKFFFSILILCFFVLESGAVIVYEIDSSPSNAIRGKEEISVSGMVTDAAGDPLIGVTVQIKGTGTGTATDFDGTYYLDKVDEDAILVFSYVGMVTLEEAVRGRSQIDVVMQEDATRLEEVVVTALNIERDRSSLGYSVTQIEGAELNRVKQNNFVNSLTGKVAGLQISKAATGLDGSSRVVLRGISSLLGNNRPLFVVDGIPVDNSFGGGGQWGGRDMGDALSDINPEDIASISVLKGAGAAALYGSRGANGAIIIQTKKGYKTEGVGITATSSYVASTPMVYPDFQNEYGHGAFGLYPTDQSPRDISDTPFPWGWSWGPAMDGAERLNFGGDMSPYSPQPDNFKNFFRNGFDLVNSLSFDHATETSTVRASITTQNAQGLMPYNNLNKQTFNLRGTSWFGDKIEIDGRITYVHHKTNDRPYLSEDNSNPGYLLSIMPRNISIDDLRKYQTRNGQEHLWTNDTYTYNPIWEMENVRNRDEKNRLQGVFATKIHLSDQLQFQVRTGMDFLNRYNHERAAAGQRGGGLGSMNQSLANDLEINTDALMTYSKSITRDIGMNLSAGGNFRYEHGKSISQGGSNFKVPDYFVISNLANYGTSEGFYEKEVWSVYGMGQFSYKNWIYLDLTARNDWSSTLPVQNNSYFYHSENLSFLFSELFRIPDHILSSGKLRASYAQVGNDTGPYQTRQYYHVSQTPLPYPVGSISGELPFFDLQPEQTRSWEAGMDLSFFDHRFGVDFTWYESVSDHQIMPIPLAPSTGYGTKRANAGRIDSKGAELLIRAAPVVTHNFEWDLSVNWSKTKSIVKELYQDLVNIRLEELWHASIQAIPGEEYGMIFTTDFKRDQFGNKLVDDSGYPIKGEYKPMGNINPDWIGGFSNQLRYKNISLNFLIDMRMGGEIFSWGKAYKSLFGTGKETLEGRAEWYATHDPETAYSTPLPGVTPEGYVEQGINEKTGRPNETPIQPMLRWYNLYSKEIGAEWIQDATNVRLRELSVGFQIPGSWIERTPIVDAQISLVGYNLFFLYRAMEHVDPEASYGSGNTSTGFEHSPIPTTRNFGFNVRLNF